MLPEYAGPAIYSRPATSENAVVINGLQVPYVFYACFMLIGSCKVRKNFRIGIFLSKNLSSFRSYLRLPLRLGRFHAVRQIRLENKFLLLLLLLLRGDQWRPLLLTMMMMRRWRHLRRWLLTVHVIIHRIHHVLVRELGVSVRRATRGGGCRVRRFADVDSAVVLIIFLELAIDRRSY